MNEESTAAIILAAGGSSRLGQPKQLLSLDDKTLIRRSIEAAQGANCRPIVVVLGHEADAVRVELAGLDCFVAENQTWPSGIGNSIRVGMNALAANSKTGAAILLTCDQPFVDAALLGQLISARTRTKCPIVASSYQNTVGIPALFARSCFDELLRLRDAEGAKRIITDDPGRVTLIPFPKGEIDIDTVSDFERLRSG